jgi:hypothetical protein
MSRGSPFVIPSLSRERHKNVASNRVMVTTTILDAWTSAPRYGNREVT